jgi:hypothetical protein
MCGSRSARCGITPKILTEDPPNLVDEVENILKAIGPASSSDL